MGLPGTLTLVTWLLLATALGGCVARRPLPPPPASSARMELRLDTSVVERLERSNEIDLQGRVTLAADFVVQWVDGLDVAFPRFAPAQAPVQTTTLAGRPARRVGWLTPQGDAVEWLVMPPPATAGELPKQGFIYAYYVARQGGDVQELDTALARMVEAQVALELRRR